MTRPMTTGDREVGQSGYAGMTRLFLTTFAGGLVVAVFLGILAASFVVAVGLPLADR